MKKNESCKLEIVDMGMNFEGIAKYDGKIVFVPGAIVGEKVIGKIIKDTTNYSIAKIQKIEYKSEHRIEESCSNNAQCGGCVANHMDYNFTLKVKKDIVINTMKKQEIDTSVIGDIFGMENPYNYRNKVQYPVRNISGKNIMGMFSERSHNIVAVETCLLQDSILDETAKDMFFAMNNAGFVGYNEEKKTGDIKNIMVRIGKYTGEILCIFVVNNRSMVKNEKLKEIINALKGNKNIKGIILNVNDADTNVILSDENIVIYGEDCIIDKIGNKVFKISTNSFFQVNTIGANTLYSLLAKNMKLDKSDKLLELYSGVGTIGIFLSDNVKEVYGVEIVKDAVKMAEENVRINNCENIKYIQGDAKKCLNQLNDRGIYFDDLIVDPPRRGLDLEGIETILELKPKKIGYVSCNPATLARDLKLLGNEYEIEKIDMVDMFPWTSHVECVAVLGLKQS